MRLHEDTVSQVRDRAQIIDLFEGQQMKRIGREFAVRCPWHDDNSPSLSISPQKNFAYCPVCAKGVDAIGWVQDREGLSFSEAVQSLAGKYNIECKPANPEDAERIQRENAERRELYLKREQQEKAWHEALFTAPEARDYLKGRGLTKATVVEFGLGWNASARRVMFPLRDPQGRTIAFTGRVLDDSKPKYKNSPNDLLYSKSKMVFGLDKARQEIVKQSHVVISEGQFDVIRLWQEGIRNVIAVSGSSLTKGMIESLVRTTRLEKVTLCFDGDLGGRKAAERAIVELQEFALRGDIDLNVLIMPEGKDPADCCEEFASMLKTSVSWVEHLFNDAISKLDMSDPSALAQAEKGVKQILRILPEGSLRSWVQERAKQVLRVVPKVAPAVIRTQAQIDKCAWAERRALRLFFHTDRDDHRQALEALSYQDPMNQKAWALVSTLQGMGIPSCHMKQVSAQLMKKDEVLYDAMRPLLKPIPEILRVITANPQGELESAFEILMAECCSDSNQDRNTATEETDQ